MSQRFALLHDGRLYVHLGGHHIRAGTPRAFPGPSPDDGVELTETEGERGWLTADWPHDAAPESVVIEHPPRKVTTSYRLADDFTHLAGERYPATLDPDEFKRRAGDWDDPFDPSMRKMYEAQQVDEPVEPTVYDGPFLLLNGAPAPRDGLTYVAKLPYALAYRNEYCHLFPGYLTDFRDAVKRRLEALTDLDIDLYTHSSTPSIFVKHPQGKGYLFHEDPFRLPWRIDGENREDAKAKWEAKLDEVEQSVRARAVVCPTCHGTGLPPAAAAPAKRRRRR